MEVHSLVESVVMENGIEVIVNKTTIEQTDYPNRPYLVRVDGLFKPRKAKSFSHEHFTVLLYANDGLGSWSTECSEGDTFSFFDLSSGDKPSERADFLCYCLKQKEAFDFIKNEFGIDSDIYKWIDAGGPILFFDTPTKRR